MAVLVEAVVCLNIDRSEFERRYVTTKPLHRSFASLKWHMDILRPIVAAATDFLTETTPVSLLAVA
jgi:hypothetical protein